MNKLLLFINYLMTKDTIGGSADKWNISESVYMVYIKDVMYAIILFYINNSNIISIPSKNTQKNIYNLLKQCNYKFPNCIYLLDNTHKRCVGQKKNLLSWKFKFKASYSHLFIICRLTGLIVSIDLCNNGSESDITILKKSSFGQNINNLLNNSIFCLADSGYWGFKSPQFVMLPKRNTLIYKAIGKNFRKNFRSIRVQIECFFGKFYINQNKRLIYWEHKGNKSRILHELILLCACVCCNLLIINNLK